MEHKLFLSARSGLVDEVATLLRDHPDVQVNSCPDSPSNLLRLTPLHAASKNGHAEVVKLLLAHPGIEVNPLDSLRTTPYLAAIIAGHAHVVRLFLDDPRVDTALYHTGNISPVWMASYHGRLDVLKWMFASGRRLDCMGCAVKMYGKYRIEHEVADDGGHKEVADLVRKFTSAPELTRKELRLELGLV